MLFKGAHVSRKDCTYITGLQEKQVYTSIAYIVNSDTIQNYFKRYIGTTHKQLHV